jgi:maleylpyruvate isomerase
MTAGRATADVRAWMAGCTSRFLTAVDRLEDAAWDGPSLLPGWRRREVVAHVHHNAEAIGNLATWASTGNETPMYPSAEHRDAGIARTAELPVDELRRLVRSSAAALAEQLDQLPADALDREVRTTRGRPVLAREIVWMRTREVAVHGVDLDHGLGFDDLPPDLIEALVHDVVGLRLERGEGSTLAAWLTGRGTAGRDLGPWT